MLSRDALLETIGGSEGLDRHVAENLTTRKERLSIPLISLSKLDNAPYVSSRDMLRRGVSGKVSTLHAYSIIVKSNDQFCLLGKENTTFVGKRYDNTVRLRLIRSEIARDQVPSVKIPPR